MKVNNELSKIQKDANKLRNQNSAKKNRLNNEEEKKQLYEAIEFLLDETGASDRVIDLFWQ